MSETYWAVMRLIDVNDIEIETNHPLVQGMKRLPAPDQPQYVIPVYTTQEEALANAEGRYVVVPLRARDDSPPPVVSGHGEENDGHNEAGDDQ